MRNLVKASFFRRIVAPAMLAILLFLAAVFAFVIPAFEHNAIDQKKRMLLELTNTAWSILNNYQNEVEAGLLDSVMARTKAIAEVEALRYGPDKKDYFWIIDEEPVMVMHPYVHELMGRSLHDYADPDGTKPFIEATHIAQQSGEGFIRYKWQFKDDSTRIVPKLSFVKAFPKWGWIIGTGIYLDDVEHEIAQLTNKLLLILLGITLFITLIIIFITVQSLRIENQRQEAERQLLESKEKYRSLAESSTEGLLLLLDGKIAYSNHYVQNLLHYSAKELESLTITDLIAGKSPIDQSHGALESRHELNFKRKDGSLTQALLTILPVHFADKDGLLLTIRDVQEHRAVKQELEDYKLRFENLAQHSKTGIFRFPLRGQRLSYFNRGVAELLGYNNETLLNNVPLSDIIENRQTLRQLLAEVRDKGVISRKPVALRKRNGELTTQLLSLFLMHDDQGNTIYCDGILEPVVESADTSGMEKFAQTLQLLSAFENAPAISIADPIVHCPAGATLEQAIESMRQEKSTHVLLNLNNEYIGILTNKDIISRIPSGNQPLQQPASSIMTSPVIRAPGHISLSEALGIMISKEISHLVLSGADDKPTGILRKDKIAETAARPVALFQKSVDNCNDASCLARLRNALPQIIRPIAEGRGNMQSICNIISAANDAITARIVALAEKELGPPPVPYSFVLFGSAGREELVFSSDQDNAIVYADVEPEKTEETNAYFMQLGKKICDRLSVSGLPFCPGGFMASNPVWCQPLNTWKEYFEKWIAEPDPENILNLSVFFDLRHGFGDKKLFDALQDHIFESFEGKTTFFYLLAQSAMHIKPPTQGAITLQGVSVQDAVDLKGWTALAVMFARIYALKKQIRATNTIQRIKALQQMHVWSNTTAEEVLFHFQYLMQLRVTRQIEDIMSGVPAGNHVSARRLGEMDQIILKKVFAQMGHYNERLSAEFMSAFKG